MGLTKAEFEEFLREADNVHLEKVGEATLRFAPESDSRFRLDGGDTLNQLNGVVIDLKRNVVETPLGVCSDRSDFAASADQHLTGPANGTEWALRQGDDTTPTLTTVEFVLGRIVATGRVFLSYTAKHVVGGKADVGDMVTVTYSL